MRKRIASWMAVLMVFTLIGGAAHAEEATVTAAVTSVDGLRVIAPILPVALLSLGNGTLSAPILVTVDETLAKGANWSLEMKSTNFTGATGATLTASALAMGTSTVTRTLGGGSMGSLGSGSLDTPRQIYAVTGQDPNLAYSGAYASSSPLTLTVPNETTLDAYTATITVTLLTGS